MPSEIAEQADPRSKRALYLTKLKAWTWLDVYCMLELSPPTAFAEKARALNRERLEKRMPPGAQRDREISSRMTGRSTLMRAHAIAFALNGGAAYIEAATPWQEKDQVAQAQDDLRRIDPDALGVVRSARRRRSGTSFDFRTGPYPAAVFRDHPNP